MEKVWDIFFIDDDQAAHDMYIKADNFDTAIDFAREFDCRFSGGYLMPKNKLSGNVKIEITN